MALNETTGTVLWSAGPNGQPSFNFSTRAGVTIDAGNVFAGTQDSRLVSLNAMNGALNWQTSNLQGIKRADLTEYEGPEATPLVYNGEIIVGESGGIMVGEVSCVPSTRATAPLFGYSLRCLQIQ